MQFLAHLRIYAIGLCMGTADLIPGVSGGTIAFVCGIYHRLLDGIKSFDVTTLRLALRRDWAALGVRVPWWFLISLGLGIVTAIFTLSHLLARLFVTHPEELWAFFFGLVAASIGLLVKQTWRWSVPDVMLFALFGAATYWLVGLPILQFPHSLPFVFLAGAIAICAMILPGISGSYILVILGQYHAILDAVNARDFLKLGVFVAGIVVGILSFVRIVSWLLRRWPHPTLIALTGIMAGALRTVWPWKTTLTTRINSDGLEVPMTQANIAPPDGAAIGLALALAIAGAIAVIVISHLAPEQDPERKHA